MKKQLLKASLLVLPAIVLMSCNRLTDEAKAMVGDYYIPEISQDQPIFELKDNGKCVVSAVEPNVLTYHIEGKWNVIDDSLKIDLDPQKITFEGDSTLIPEIKDRHRSYAVVSYNDINLVVRRDGLQYSLHRHVDEED